MNLQTKLFGLNQQASLLQQIQRLSKVGIHQREIAEQLVKYGSSAEKQIGVSLLKSIDSGEPFSDALKPWFNRMVWESLLAGETSGDWQGGLANALETIYMQNISTMMLIKALMKPLAGLITLLFACACAYWFFFPMMMDLLPVPRWGGLSKFAYSFSQFWANKGLYMIFGLIALTMISIVSLPLAPIGNGKIRKYIDYLPIFSHYRLITSTNLLRSLSNLTRAGLNLLEGIDHLAYKTTPYLKWHLSNARRKIQAGESNIGNIFDTGLIQEQNIRTMRIIGETGNHYETFQNSAELHGSLLENKMTIFRVWGSVILKIAALIITLIVGGGIAQLITDMTTQLRF